MKVRNLREVADSGEIPGVSARVVISADDGAPNFVMRVFEVQPGKSTPWHSHDWEHVVFVLAGRGELVGNDGRLPLSLNDAVLVMPNEQHQFVNAGPDVFRFVCCIPHVKQP